RRARQDSPSSRRSTKWPPWLSQRFKIVLLTVTCWPTKPRGRPRRRREAAADAIQVLSNRVHGSSLADAPSTPRGLSLALGDRLFGGTEPGPGPSRRWLLRYLGVAALLASIIVARRPDAVTNPQFWAEDSVIYFWENLRLGFWGALANFYNDYPMLVQRLIAG